jgi:hypothetical protein
MFNKFHGTSEQVVEIAGVPDGEDSVTVFSVETYYNHKDGYLRFVASFLQDKSVAGSSIFFLEGRIIVGYSGGQKIACFLGTQIFVVMAEAILAKFRRVHTFAARLVQDLFHVIPYLVILSAFLVCFLSLYLLACFR